MELSFSSEKSIPLTDLRVDTNAKVLYLNTKHRGVLQKMIAMGVLPDSQVLLIQKYPSYVLQIGKTQFAIDSELAQCVYVSAG